MDVKRLLAALACMGGMALAQQDSVYSNFIWSGIDADATGRVETGSPDSTSGWWYNFSDDDDGGTSRIIFPADMEIYQDGPQFEYLVEAYGGIKASVELGEGYEFPYAGFGFNIWSEKMEGVDISAWGGICLSYESTLDFNIELLPEDEENLTGQNNYKAKVAKAATMTTIDFSWEKFKQSSGWGKEADKDSVLAKTAAVRLKFEAVAGTKGDFLIKRVGSFGMCGCCVPPDRIGNGPVAVPVKATLSGRTLEFTGATALEKATVIDLQGNVVISASALGAMDLSTLPSGIYMLRIDGPTVHHSQKIVLK